MRSLAAFLLLVLCAPPLRAEDIVTAVIRRRATTTTTTTTTSTTTTTGAGSSTTTTTTSTTTTTTVAGGALVCTVLTHGTSTTSGTIFTTASVSPPSNHLIEIFTGATGNTSGTPTISGNGLTWGQFGGEQRANDPTNYRLDGHHALGSSPSTGAITITYGSSVTNAAWSVIECSPVNTSSTISQANATDNNGVFTSISGSMGAFGSVNNGVLAAVLSDRNCSTILGSGYSSLSEDCITGTTAVDASDLLVEWRSDNDSVYDASFTEPGGRNAMAVGLEVNHQ